MKSNLRCVPFALKIGEYSLKKIKQNLAMSFACKGSEVNPERLCSFNSGIGNTLVMHINKHCKPI